jgi:hypothetical protein
MTQFYSRQSFNYLLLDLDVQSDCILVLYPIYKLASGIFFHLTDVNIASYCMPHGTLAELQSIQYCICLETACVLLINHQSNSLKTLKKKIKNSSVI